MVSRRFAPLVLALQGFPEGLSFRELAGALGMTDSGLRKLVRAAREASVVEVRYASAAPGAPGTIRLPRPLRKAAR